MIANLAVISNFLAGRGSSYKAAAAAPVDELAADLPRLLQVRRTWTMTTEPGSCMPLHTAYHGEPNRPDLCLQELMPFMPEVAREVVPQLVERLIGRVTARALRDVYTAGDVYVT